MKFSLENLRFWRWTPPDALAEINRRHNEALNDVTLNHFREECRRAEAEKKLNETLARLAEAEVNLAREKLDKQEAQDWLTELHQWRAAYDKARAPAALTGSEVAAALGALDPRAPTLTAVRALLEANHWAAAAIADQAGLPANQREHACGGMHWLRRVDAALQAAHVEGRAKAARAAAKKGTP